MAETQTSIVDEGRERLNAARDRIDEEIQRVQQDLNGRRKRLEKQFAKNRKSFEKQTRKQVRELQRDLRKNSVVKGLEKWRGQAESQIGETVERVLGTIGLASRDDLGRVERKLARINKRLTQIERGQAHGGTSGSASA